MNGCPCEPNGTDGLTCPDKDRRLLCQTSPSRARPSADAVANAFWHAVAYAKLGDVTAQQFVNAVIERARKAPEARAGDCDAFDMLAHLQRQREWSERTFGPGARTAGVVDHIRKELFEVEAAPEDGEEWVDVIILALDGAWRAGLSPQEIVGGIVAKQTKNERRAWPDWRTAHPLKAIEHDRSRDRPAPRASKRCTRCDGLGRLTAHSVPCTRCSGSGEEP